MDRILIVPAAGRGSRLGVPGPKALAPVAGRPMLEWLIDRHGHTVGGVIVVAAPAALDDFRAFSAESGRAIDLAVQDEPTGMLDAILLARPLVERRAPRRVVVTWCDQIAVAAETIERLRERGMRAGAPALVLPTNRVHAPYIHFDRDATGRIAEVRQRREGDAMPDEGEADMGLFDLALDAYLHDLPEFAAETPRTGGTGERNFLPFIPWLAARRAVETIAGVSPIESVGVNTPEELRAIAAHLSGGRAS